MFSSNSFLSRLKVPFVTLFALAIAVSSVGYFMFFTTQRISAQAVASNPVARWQFAEGSGSSVSDSTGNGYMGNINTSRYQYNADETGTFTPIAEYEQGASGFTVTRSTTVTYGSPYSWKFTGTCNTDCYSYWRVSDNNYTIQNGDYLEYDIYVDSASASVVDSKKAYVDMDSTTNTHFRWTYSEQPTIQDQWVHKDIDLSSLAGTTIDQLLISLDRVVVAGSYTVYYDNMQITNGTAAWGTGKFGGGVALDGINDYVRADTVPAGIAGGDFSLSYWMKTSAHSASVMGVTTAVNTWSGGDKFLTGVEGGAYKFWDASTGVWNTVISSINNGQWHHIAHVHDTTADTVAIYVDGILKKTVTGVSTVVASNDRFSLGQEWDNNVESNFFSGSLDEVQVYDRTLSASEVTTLADATIPTLDGLTVLDSTWGTDGSNTYDIVLKATDAGSGVLDMRTLINYQGSNTANPRGEFGWHSWGYLFGGDQMACTGGGYASKHNTDWGYQYTTLVGCKSVLGGSQRTVVLTVKPLSNFGTFGSINDISFHVYDTAGNPSGWQNYDTNFSSNASVPTVSVSGAPASWTNADQTATIGCSGCDVSSLRLKTYTTSPGSCPASYDQNLFNDPGFETGGFPAGGIFTSAANASLSIGTSAVTTPHSGTYFLQILAGSAGDGYTLPYSGQSAALVSATNGDNLQLSTWAKGNSNQQMQLSIFCLDQNYTVLSGGTTTTTVTSSWQQYSVNKICGSGTLFASVRIDNDGVNNSKLWIDDMSFTKNAASAYGLFSPQTVSSYSWMCAAATSTNGNAGFSTPVEFKVDKTAPNNPTTFTGTIGGVSASGLYVDSTNPSLQMNWSGASDPESGIVNYQTVLQRASDGIWIYSPLVGNVASYLLSTTGLADGQSYHYWIRSQNGAGQNAAAFKLGGTFSIDASAPTTPGAPTTSWAGDHYVNTNFTMAGSASTDVGSGVRGYRLCRSNDNASGCSVWVGAETVTQSQLVSSTHLPTNGTYRYYYWYAYDNLGHQSAPSTGTYIRMDTTSPTGSISYTNGWARSLSVTTTESDSGSGVQTCELQRAEATLVNGTPGTFGSWSTVQSNCVNYNVGGANNTAYKFRYRVRDNVGNWSAWQTGTAIIKIDTVLPTCGDWAPDPAPWISGEVAADTGQDFTLTNSVDNSDGSGMNVAGGSCPIPVTVHNGTCTVPISDVAGNTVDCISPPAQIDAGAPTTNAAVIAGTPGDNGWYISDVQVKITPNDSLSGVDYTEYCTDTTNTCTPVNTYSAPITFSAEGTTYLRYRSVDNVNNVQAPQSFPVTIDKTPPTMTVDPTSQTVTGTNIVINLTPDGTNSPVSTARYVIDGTADASTGTTFVSATQTTINSTNVGLHYLTYWLKDAAGLETSGQLQWYTVLIPPASCTFNPTTVGTQRGGLLQGWLDACGPAFVGFLSQNNVPNDSTLTAVNDSSLSEILVDFDLPNLVMPADEVLPSDGRVSMELKQRIEGYLCRMELAFYDLGDIITNANLDDAPFGISPSLSCTRSSSSCEDLSWTNAATYGSLYVCGESDAAPLNTCSGLKTYAEAKTFCENAGARLCSWQELNSNETSGTGCSYDNLRIWTSSPCSQSGYWTQAGNTANVVSYPLECTVATNTAYVRCCADISQ